MTGESYRAAPPSRTTTGTLPSGLIAGISSARSSRVIICQSIRPGWPVSTTFEVSRLAHPDMMIEIDMIAVVD